MGGPHLRFCPTSNDLLYPKEDRTRKRLVYTCKTCGYQVRSTKRTRNEANKRRWKTRKIRRSEEPRDPTRCVRQGKGNGPSPRGNETLEDGCRKKKKKKQGKRRRGRRRSAKKSLTSTTHASGNTRRRTPNQDACIETSSRTPKPKRPWCCWCVARVRGTVRTERKTCIAQERTAQGADEDDVGRGTSTGRPCGSDASADHQRPMFQVRIA
mmetsp:Transcript_7080/g.43680  ORF Transcript_7080/g.43680 Transcript_7080/m.43680 type:complete len:211 (+) Transcript_7080:93-725(+)